MRDQFVGDIGDFSNNGLLRYLCGLTGPQTDNPLRSGVACYINDSDGPEGNEINYLNVSDSNDSTYRVCDPELYGVLQRLVGASLVCRTKRNLGQTSNGLILPANTSYHDVPVPIGDRSDWLEGAINKVCKDTDLVFVNPDTGIASKDQERRPSQAHVTVKELARIYEEGKSLIVYQHIGQGHDTAEARIRTISERLTQELQPIPAWKPWALRWRRVIGRVYFIVARTKEHKDKIEGRLEAFRGSVWIKKGHFTEAEA